MTAIVSDCCLSYFGIENEDYNHLTVNHTYNFVDPELMSTHRRKKICGSYQKNNNIKCETKEN